MVQGLGLKIGVKEEVEMREKEVLQQSTAVSAHLA
jgi:hypothetical protein